MAQLFAAIEMEITEQKLHHQRLAEFGYDLTESVYCPGRCILHAMN